MLFCLPTKIKATSLQVTNIIGHFRLVYCLGMPSRYATKSLSDGFVNYTAQTGILNNKSMFVLGLSYDSAKSKKSQIDKKLNNDIANPATF